MKTEFKSNEWSDFNQRYKGTYGWFERENKPSLLVKVVAVDSDVMSFTDKTGFSFSAQADQGNFFSFIPVIRGMYKCLDTVTLVQRVPARMYKRGICQENTQMHNLYLGNINTTFESIEGMLNTKIEDEIALFKEKLQNKDNLDNVLLSHQFSVKENCIYLYENKIGKFAAYSSVKLTSPLFAQEVADIFCVNNIDMEVLS